MDLPDNILAGSSSKSAPAPKRRKTNGASSTSNANSDDGTGNNNKPKRQPSCDLCRARKVRCVKADGQTRCDGCIGLNQQCAYTHERKKPGPANRQVNMVLPDRALTLRTVLLRNLPPVDRSVMEPSVKCQRLQHSHIMMVMGINRRHTPILTRYSITELTPTTNYQSPSHTPPHLHIRTRNHSPTPSFPIRRHSRTPSLWTHTGQTRRM